MASLVELDHPVVGRLDPTYEAFELPSEPGLTMLVYTAEPDSPNKDALDLLASWVATLAQAPASAQERRST